MYIVGSGANLFRWQTRIEELIQGPLSVAAMTPDETWD